MQNIRLTPTKVHVAKETLNRSKAVIKECLYRYAIASYDLVVAKIARQIQIKNSPKFDNCFVEFGHIPHNFFITSLNCKFAGRK